MSKSNEIRKYYQEHNLNMNCSTTKKQVAQVFNCTVPLVYTALKNINVFSSEDEIVIQKFSKKSKNVMK